MILTEYNICHYLLNKGMLDTATLVKGEFTARRSDSRNNNFIINKEFGHHHYFVKQVKASDQEKIETLKTEATCYQFAGDDKKYEALKKFLPKFYAYDTQQHILVLEEIKNSISLHEYYLAATNFDLSIPRKIAELLSSYHATISPEAMKEPGFAHFQRQVPWIFNIPRQDPGQWMGPANTAEQQAMQLIYKNKELLQLISLQQQLWKPTSLVHNDVKFTNFLTNEDLLTNGLQMLKLIDWELADIGDPLWDVASVFQHYLMLWITTDDPKANLYPAFRKVTIEEIQPQVAEFWKEYCRSMNISSKKEALEKITAFCAIKLIHSSFEFAPHSPTLQPISARLLQMALNILRSPARAAAQLFTAQNMPV